MLYTLQDDELDISPVEIDEGLVIEDDEISDDDDDENDDVCWFIVPFTELYRLKFVTWGNILLQIDLLSWLDCDLDITSHQIFGYFGPCAKEQ